MFWLGHEHLHIDKTSLFLRHTNTRKATTKTDIHGDGDRGQMAQTVRKRNKIAFDTRLPCYGQFKDKGTRRNEVGTTPTSGA